jgi:hypothetical protein
MNIDVGGKGRGGRGYEVEDRGMNVQRYTEIYRDIWRCGGKGGEGRGREGKGGEGREGIVDMG